MPLLPRISQVGRTVLRQLGSSRTPRDFIAIGLFVLLVLGGLGSTWWLLRHTIAINKLSRGIGQTMFYGADGRPWFALEEHRRDVPLGQVSPYLQHAVIAIEDRRFDSHPGVDPIALARAAIRNARARAIVEGGSTLTVSGPVARRSLSGGRQDGHNGRFQGRLVRGLFRVHRRGRLGRT